MDEKEIKTWYKDITDPSRIIKVVAETRQLSDAINPSHYQEYNGFEVIDVTEQLNFCLGNAVKYVLRAGKKADNSKEQDLKKAIWYLERELLNGKTNTGK